MYRHNAYLEITHQRCNFLLQCLIGNSASSQVDLVPDENDGYLNAQADQQHSQDEPSQKGLTFTPSLLNSGSQYSATLSNVLGSAIE